MKKIISRKDALILNKKHFFTGVPCKYGHNSERLVSNRSCCACKKEHKSKYKQIKIDRSDYFKIYNKTRQANKEKQKLYWKKWVENNKQYKAIQKAKEKAAKLERMPKWLTKSDHEKIKLKYKEARWMTERTGIKHHVDHYYPLRGKTVSGLHVPSNLRVIPAISNIKKSNQVPAFDRLPL